MKRKILITVIVALILGGTFYFVKKMTTRQSIYMFNISKEDDLESILLSKGAVQKEITDMQEIENIIYVLDGDGRTTKKESTNDYPISIEQPIKVELKSGTKKDNIAVIYIYEDNSRYYLEQPYNGIYQISSDEYNGILKYLQLNSSHMEKSANKTNEKIVVEDSVKNPEVLLEVYSDEKKISSSKTIEVKMVNNSRQDILTGDAYKIEIFRNNEWLEVPIDTSYEDVAYSILAGEEKNFICTLEDISESGLYRIGKSYSIENEKGESLTEYVYTEFEIKNSL